MLTVAGSGSFAAGLGGLATRSRTDDIGNRAKGLAARLRRLMRLHTTCVSEEHDGAVAPPPPAAGPDWADAAGGASLPVPANADGTGTDTGIDAASAAARLEGVRLAGRTIAHLVNNDLALTVGALDLLRTHPELPPQLLGLLDDAIAGLYAATSDIERVRRITRVVTCDSPAGPSLDLDRCT